MSPLPRVAEVDMEDEDYAGGYAVSGQCLRHAYIRQRVCASLGERFPDTCPKAFAAILEAVASSHADEVEIFRSWRIRQ